MRRRILKLLLLAGVLIGLVDLYRSDRLLFRYPDGKIERAEARVARYLAERHQVALLFTADQLPGRDWVSGKAVELAGTTARRGRFGTALHFDGRRRNFVNLPLRWRDLGPSFSMALWVRLDPASIDQEILFTRDDEPVGFKLDRGRMSFFLSLPGQQRAVSYAFTNYQQFVQVVVVVDGARGTTRLYENGVVRGELPAADYAVSQSRLTLGKSSDEKISEPLMGEVDEVVVWRRALAEAEIAAFAAHPRSALSSLAPREIRSYRNARTLQAGVRKVLKLVDLFNPAMHPGRAQRHQGPEINLILSKPDAQYFAKAHRQSLRDGRQSSASAQGRAIDVVEQGRGFRGQLSLFGKDDSYPASPRRSYILEPAPGETVLGLSRLRLMPPEEAGWLEPLVETRVARELGVPTISNGLCQLVINGERMGLYYYEDYQTLGVPQGFGARRFEGLPTRKSWLRVSLPDAPPLTRDELVRLRDEVLATYRDSLIRDALSPLSGREIQYRLRESKLRMEGWPLDEKEARAHPVDQLADRLTSFFVLGRNPSPFFLVQDLDLALKVPAHVQVTWSARDPGVLTEEGRILPPQDGRPSPAALTARITDGVTSRLVTLDFRVMPAARKLPAYFLWTDTALQRLARVDCAVTYLPAAADEPVRQWLAAQDERSGISWRGHTSMRQAKKPFGLRLPEPHGFWGTTNVLKVNLVNPFRDPTFWRNRLSYDLFRRFGGPGQRRDGLPVSWVEVFVNGKYFGLYESSPAVRAEWLGLSPYAQGESRPTLMFKASALPPSLSDDRWLFMRQTEPSRRHGNWVDEVMDLQRFLQASSPETFVREVDQWLDLDNLRDFHLLLNLTENYNGWPFNFAIHDILVRPAGQQRYFLVPFDFDTTWDPFPVGRYCSKVFERLRMEYPGYEESLARRWQELRQGPLDLAALEAEVRQHQALLDGYVEWDDRRWNIHHQRPHAQRVDQLVQAIRRRFAELDAKYAATLQRP